MIVQRKYKSLSVFNIITEGLLWQFVRGSFGIGCEDGDVIACLGEVAEHFFEAVGVAGDVGEGGGFD